MELGKKLNKLDSTEKLGIFLFCLSIFFLIVCVIKINFSLNVDETFSLLITSTTFHDTTYLTAVDVHPPLYYYILKIFVDFFSIFGINSSLSGQILSVIPVILLLILSITKIKDIFGYLTAGTFALCITSMPNFMYYIVDIRMYLWACFFVTVSYICIYYSINRSQNIKYWVLLTVFSICAMYTHYFGVLSSFSLYLILFIYFLLKNKKEIKKCLISFIILIIAYIPWISIVLSQINNYKDNYWISSFNLDKLFVLIQYMFSSNDLICQIFGVLLICSIFVLFYFFIVREKDELDWFGSMGFMIFILTLICSLIVSFVVMPIFDQRYMFVTFGCFWLAFSIFLGKIKDRKKFLMTIVVILLCVSFFNTMFYIGVSDAGIKNYDIYTTMDLHDGDVIICDNLFTALTFSRYYNPGCDYYVYKIDDVNFTQVVENATKGNHSVWLFSNLDDNQFNDGTMIKNFSMNYTLFNKFEFEIDEYDNFPIVVYQISNK